MPFSTNSGALGLPGGSGDATHLHIQALPEAVWTINHTLNKYPAVSVVDSAGSLVMGDVRYESLSQIVITFSSAFSGKAFLN